MPLHKPGDIITPASFAVAPELLGRPLARPSRRAAAMAIDLLLVAVLVNGGGFFFGLAAAFMLWRASARTDLAVRTPRLRKAFRLASAGVLFLVVAMNWGFWTRPLKRLADDRDDSTQSGDSTEDAARGGATRAAATTIATMGQVIALRHVKTEPEARRVADGLVRELRRSGASGRELRKMQEELARQGDGPLSPVATAALTAAIARQGPDESAPPAVPDSVALAYTRALARGDGLARDTLAPRLVTAFGADTLSALHERVNELGADNKQLRRQLHADSARAANTPSGLIASAADAGSTIMKMLKKAGLGFGWLGLYFTGFVALTRGQTPGKWLMRIRIVRLDGRPMGWWSALERFGGYAASVVTALSGFFQILWDKNRQAMHDKIAETVVVRV